MAIKFLCQITVSIFYKCENIKLLEYILFNFLIIMNVLLRTLLAKLSPDFKNFN